MSDEKCQLHVDDYEQRLRAATDALRAARRRERSVAAHQQHDEAVGREIAGQWVQFYERLADLDDVGDLAAQHDSTE